MENDQLILKLSGAQAQIHRDFYKGRIEALLNQSSEVREYEDYKKLLASIDALLKPVGVDQKESEINGHTINSKTPKSLQAEPSTVDEKNSAFNQEWALARKAEYAVHISKRLLTTREMIDIILENEPDYYEKRQIDFDRLQKNLGSSLKQKINTHKTFFRHRVEGKPDYIYGLLADKGIYGELKKQNSHA